MSSWRNGFEAVLVNARKVSPPRLRGALRRAWECACKPTTGRGASLSGRPGAPSRKRASSLRPFGGALMRASLRAMAKQGPRVDELVRQACERIRTVHPEAVFEIDPHRKYCAGYVTAYVNAYVDAEEPVEALEPQIA